MPLRDGTTMLLYVGRMIKRLINKLVEIESSRLRLDYDNFIANPYYIRPTCMFGQYNNV